MTCNNDTITKWCPSRISVFLQNFSARIERKVIKINKKHYYGQKDKSYSEKSNFFIILKRGFNFSEKLIQKLVAVETTKSIYSNQLHQNLSR